METEKHGVTRCIWGAVSPSHVQCAAQAEAGGAVQTLPGKTSLYPSGLEYQSPCRYIFETGAEEKVSIGGSDAPGLRRGDFPRVRAPETWSLMLTLLGMFCHLQQLCELFLAEPGTERTMCSWEGPISFKVPSAFLPSLVSGENQEEPTALSCREETPV